MSANHETGGEVGPNGAEFHSALGHGQTQPAGELIHLPRQEREETHEELAAIPLGNIIADAAGQLGQTPVHADESETSINRTTARDYSPRKVLRDGYGIPIDEAPLTSVHSRAVVDTPEGGTATASTEFIYVGDQAYVVSNRVHVHFREPGGSPTLVSIYYDRDGQILDDTPIIELGPNVEKARRMNDDEVAAMKARVVDAFGLRYESYAQIPILDGINETFAPAVVSEVNAVVEELALSGLTGKKLHHAVLRRIHPDIPENRSQNETPGEVDRSRLYAQNKLAYANTIDFNRITVTSTQRPAA